MKMEDFKRKMSGEYGILISEDSTIKGFIIKTQYTAELPKFAPDAIPGDIPLSYRESDSITAYRADECQKKVLRWLKDNPERAMMLKAWIVNHK